jgi:hypothetical protein
MNEKYNNIYISILIHLLLIIIINSLFFWFYFSKKEKLDVLNEINSSIDYTINSLDIPKNILTTSKYNELINYYKGKNYVQKNNNIKNINITIIIFFIILIVSIFYIRYFVCNQNFNIVEIISENIIIIVFVIIFEIVFFEFFESKIIYIDKYDYMLIIDDIFKSLL